MKVDKYLAVVRSGRAGQVLKRASRGEMLLGSMFPNRGVGWPGGWSQDRVEQVMHMTRWVYVCANLICSKVASIMPNLAYVGDTSKRGVTIKAGQRGLLNLMSRGFNGSTDVGGNYDYRLKSVSNGSAYNYSEDWRDIHGKVYPNTTFHPLGPAEGGAEFGFSDGGHSWLTMGEYRSKALSVVKPHEDLEPLESDHPLRRLVENPNPFDTHYDIEYEKQMFKLLCGVSYEWLVPNEWGVPCERWCLPSHWVWPRTGGGARVTEEMLERYPHADELIQYYELRPWGGMGSAGSLMIPADEIVMELYKSPLNKIDGYSPLAAMAQWIDLDESISKSRWAQMINQARPELHIELGPGYEDPNDDRIARMEARLQGRFQGEYNYAKPIVTPPGAKLNQISWAPNSMAYGDASDQTRDMILSGFAVPPSAVGLSKDMTYGCLDSQTECLTANGWKKYTELTTDTRVACYDLDSGTLVYRNPSVIHIYPYDGTMQRWYGTNWRGRMRFDALMTPNHRAFVKNVYNCDSSIPFGIVRVDEIPERQHFCILGAAPAACDSPVPVEVEQYGGRYSRCAAAPYFIDPQLWLEFLGYYISEGHAGKLREKDWSVIDITQHMDSPLTPKIEECLAKLPFNLGWRMYSYSEGCHWRCADRGLYKHLVQHCGRLSRNKQIPDYVKAWPAADLRILLDALIAGDGRKPRVTKSGVWQTSYRTISPQLSDDVMEIAVKCGLAVRKVEDGTIYISTQTSIEVEPQHRTEEHYTGDVWCLTVPTGLFVVRRGGTAHITGNSILATLGALCAFCLNPKLSASGQTQTKHLASRFDERAPAYSTRSGVGGRASLRRVKLWYDDCVPADPQQVNSDLQADGQLYAITPDEVRALRGRKPYPRYGNVPWVQGPGGVTPFPMDDNSLEALAESLEPMAKIGQQEQGPAEDGGASSQPSETSAGPVNRLAEQPPSVDLNDAGVEAPNGRPTKYWSNGRSRDTALTW